MAEPCSKKGMDLLFTKIPVALQLAMLNEEIPDPKVIGIIK
jgi:hypothetical protein